MKASKRCTDDILLNIAINITVGNLDLHFLQFSLEGRKETVSLRTQRLFTDHPDLIVREETLFRHNIFLSVARDYLYAPSHRQDSTYFVVPIVEHWLERDLAQWIHL